MPEKKPINLMAGLVDLSTKPGQSKMAIQVTGDDLWFDPDDKPMAQAVAQALTDQIKSNLKRGQAPTGQALPSLTGRTIDRRKKEVEQAHRGGEADRRFIDPKFRTDTMRNYTRDYTAPKLGTFAPKDGTTRGVLSGMLSESFFARPSRDGKTMTIYVAAKRGRPRPSRTERRPETKSALESVFGSVPLLDNATMNTPELRSAMQKAADGLIAKSAAELRQNAIDILKGIGEAISTAQDIGEDAGNE